MASTPSWPQSLPERRTARIVKSARRQCRRAFKGIMRSYRLKIPKYDMPLRIRPWFILITVLIMLILALLGFTNLAHALPINDKLLHFFCLGIATGVFYFIFDVEEESRRIWFWRHSPLMLTALICFFVGGVMSEFIQSMLPYKEFQFGDIVANLLGSSIGLYTAYYLERYYRQRREISRLYRPLSASLSSIHLPDDTEEENDLESGTQLLPLHLPGRKGRTKGKGRVRSDSLAMADVWDEREELFGVGDDDSD
ncbi:hypothetical protein HETIRDRAFT_385084, partial [Heterobasidion irregulare TC 32-1]